MNSVRQRVVVFGGVSILALLLLALAVTLIRRGVDADLLTDREFLGVQHLWEHSLEQEAARLRRAVGVATAIRRAADGRRDLEAVAETGLGRQGIRGLTYYDDLGHPSGTWPKGAKPIDIDGRLVSRLISGGGEFAQVRIADGQAVLLVSGRLDLSNPSRPGEEAGDVAFLATASIDEALTDFFESSGSDGFLLDSKGVPLASHGTLTWSTVAQGFQGRTQDLTTVESGGRTLRIAVIGLRDATRNLVGYICAVTDITAQERLLGVVDGGAVAVTLSVLMLLTLFYRWMVGAPLGRMAAAVAATAALAQGDTSVEVLGADRKDEVGEIARAVKVFRDRMRRLRDTDERRRRQMARQQEFIRLQMIEMAGNLPEEGQKAFLQDLERIEAASADGDGNARSMAVAVEVMAARISEQHRRLDTLVHDLKAALDTKTELFQLQQQVQIARDMQGSMLPRGIAARPGLDISGMLIYAENFDGGFYDYFVIDGGPIAITIGQPATGGLAAGFASATARTSMRALLSAGLEPAQALARTAALLAGDGTSGGYALAACVIDPEGMSLEWAGAGIEPPFLLRRLGDALDMPLGKEPPLSGDTGRRFVTARVDLPAPSTVLLVSPGAMDNALAQDRPIARERFIATLREADDTSPEGVFAALRKEGLAGAQGVGLKRDRLCVAVRVSG